MIPTPTFSGRYFLISASNSSASWTVLNFVSVLFVLGIWDITWLNCSFNFPGGRFKFSPEFLFKSLVFREFVSEEPPGYFSPVLLVESLDRTLCLFPRGDDKIVDSEFFCPLLPVLLRLTLLTCWRFYFKGKQYRDLCHKVCTDKVRSTFFIVCSEPASSVWYSCCLHSKQPDCLGSKTCPLKDSFCYFLLV